MSNSTYMNRIAVADQVNGVCKLSEPDNFLESKNCLSGRIISVGELLELENYTNSRTIRTRELSESENYRNWLIN